MNLLERAETRRETFYRLTNSADVPAAPSEGGRNLLAGTNQGKAYWSWAMANGDRDAEEVEVDGVKAVKLIKGTTTASTSWSYISYSNVLRDLIEASTKYTLSFDVNPSQDVRLIPCVMRGDAQNPMTDYPNTPDAQANQWQNISVVLTSRNPLPEPSGQVLYFRGMPAKNGNTIMFKNVKLEKGETATPYNQAPEDLGWSTATLVPTQSQRYLWKFEYVYYSDGSVEITQPTNISIAGADGTNGQSSHVHFAFADNATGGGFSLTTPKTYMGWYADFNETASNDPTKYKWGKWKGDQGVRGDKGDDGKTSYLHLAYASSANGKTGFSFTDTKQQYQGYYTDFTQSSSTDPTKYTWMDRRAGVEVGGVNLYALSKNSPLASNHITNFKQDVKTGEITFKVAGRDPYFGAQANKDEGVGTIRGVKIPVKTGQDIAVQLTNELFTKNFVSYFDGNDKAIKSFKGYQSNKFTVPASELEGVSYVTFRFGIKEETQEIGSVHTTKVKVEYGNVYTGWTPALEDTQSDIDSKADQALTQQQLNALAEKNRNMEAEMAAKASLAEVERWKQAYDEYVAQNDADKTSAEQKLITLTSRVAEWVKDWEDKKVQWSFLDTNMDFGEEGLRLGKKGSPTSILISNDRIGFYSGGSEVASMSNGTLTIDNGIFAKSLQIGHYREEVYEGDKTINVIRWID